MKPVMILVLLLAAVVADATEPLVGDRPDFTESAVAVTAGRLQVEAGFTIVDTDLVDAGDVGEVLLRFGGESGSELRVILPTYVFIEPASGHGDGIDGFGNAAVGVKRELLRGDGGTPQMAALWHVTIPVGNRDVASDDVALDLVVAAEWDLDDTVALGVNVGGNLVFADDIESMQWISGALGFGLGDRFGAFAEVYTFTDELDDFTGFADAGLTFLLNEDLQFDARVGRGMGDVDDQVMFGAGLVARY